jgi:hypothetical protein
VVNTIGKGTLSPRQYFVDFQPSKGGEDALKYLCFLDLENTAGLFYTSSKSFILLYVRNLIILSLTLDNKQISFFNFYRTWSI